MAKYPFVGGCFEIFKKDAVIKRHFGILKYNSVNAAKSK